MKLKPLQQVPVWLSALVIALFLGVQEVSRRWPQFDFCQRLEWITYDWRVRQAGQFAAPVSDRLAFVYVGDETIALFSEGKLGTNYQFGLYWPRHVYGQVVRELRAQAARVIGLDVLFGERRRDFDPWLVPTPEGPVGSDFFFQRQLEQAGNVILGATPEVPPHRLFRGAAAGLGEVSIDLDADGVLRRVKAFRDYRIWHESIRLQARLDGWDLARADVRPEAIHFRKADGGRASLAITDGYFDPGELSDTKSTGAVVRLQPAFEDVRVWHLGVTLAARELGLDLDRAVVQLDRGRILLPGSNGVSRILPVDAQGQMLIDWVVPINHTRLTQESFETVLADDILRQRGTNLPSRFRDRIVVLGSIASGNELSDRGATPIEKHGFLTSNHWNVANAILTNRFIHQSSAPLAAAVIALLGVFSAGVTWKLRPLAASLVVVVLALLLVQTGLWLYVRQRYWLPLVVPLASLVLTHGVLLTYRAFFEDNERRRIRSIFAKLVSPNVVHELLKAKKLALGGARREVTVFFADVRGFTEMVDQTQARAEDQARQRGLGPAETTAWIDAQAQEVLQTVNLYLGSLAEIIKKHEGTLDKYIGDCVMAFWGAPTPNPTHAVTAVRAAIDAQRTLYALNQQRHAENQRRERENPQRLQRGDQPLALLPLLTLGTGLNTGVVTVGLMGSDAHILSYTVFGRDVNLAARLESVSGRGRILIGETTYRALQKDAPELAAASLELPPVTVKGIRAPVKVFEVPWKTPAPAGGAAPVKPAQWEMAGEPAAD